MLQLSVGSSLTVFHIMHQYLIHFECGIIDERSFNVHLLFNSASGQSTNNPLQIQSLERDQHQTSNIVQVYGTFWIHDVMSCPAAHILLKTTGGSLVHPAEIEEDFSELFVTHSLSTLVLLPSLSFIRQFKVSFISPTCYKDGNHLAAVMRIPIIFKGSVL